jgi:hypothetical protein
VNLAAATFPAVLLLALTSVMLIVNNNWRWMILLLAFQYIGVFLLVTIRWPLELAVSKIVAGWMASAVLSVAIHEINSSSPLYWQETEKFWPSGRLFRLLAAGLVILTVLSISPRLAGWVEGIEGLQTVGALTLIGMGLLHLGLTAQPFRVVIGLLTILSGFEILLSAVEVSALIAGLLAFVTLGLALVGAYLLLAPSMQEAQ